MAFKAKRALDANLQSIESKTIETAEIYTCAFVPDGTAALIGSHGNPVALWNLMSGSLVRTYEHTGPVWALAWSRDRRVFLSLDGTMQLWDVETSRCLRKFDGYHARCVAWSADQRRLLSASHDRTVRLWDAETGQCLHVFEGQVTGVVSAAFSDDQRSALSCDWSGDIRVWDLTKVDPGATT